MSKLTGWLLALSLACTITGCGGGGGTTTQEPRDHVETQWPQVLNAAKMTIRLETAKDIYQPGEAVRFWLSLRNDDSNPHTIEVRSRGLNPAGDPYDTYVFAAYDRLGHSAWSDSQYGTYSWVIQPGQSIKVLDCQWNQTTNGSVAVAPGHYEVETEIDSVWLDGEEKTTLPLGVSHLIDIR